MFSERLKELRTQKGYSMDKLIDLYNSKYDAKMNKSTLSRYENGLQDPIYTVVVNLANLLHVTVDYLSGGEDEVLQEAKKEDAVSDIFIRLRKEEKFLNAVQKIYKLNDKQLDALLSMLTFFEQD